MQRVNRAIQNAFGRFNLALKREPPWVERHYPYRGQRAMIRALGPKLAQPTTWPASDSPLPQGDMTSIFEDSVGAHKWAHYLPIYEAVLAPFRSRPIRMLEVGVYRGGSLAMWRKYLHPESVIVGIDIDPACAQFEDTANGTHVRIGSQADPQFLQQVADEFGPFDVILDDGSHISGHIITTFQHMFDAVAEGGVYMVEDIHANYWPSHRDSQTTFIDFTYQVMNAMHAHYPALGNEPYARVGHPLRAESVEVPLLTTMLNRVEVFDSVAIFHRQRRNLPRSIHNDAEFRAAATGSAGPRP